MKRWLSYRSFFTSVAVILLTGGVLVLSGTLGNGKATLVTATVEEGVVRQMVSVTGTMRAENTAELGFAVGGIVETVHVRKGEVVATGTPLVSLSGTALRAAVLDAEASLQSARANLLELETGVRSETKNAAEETVRLKTATLERTRVDEAQKVANARRVWLSSNLTALTEDADENATAPTVSGTYNCDNEGTYEITIYRSNSPSGYSLELAGLERGTYLLSDKQALPFGKCGLRMQITAGDHYHNSRWLVEIPNRQAATFAANDNAYTLARSNADSAIALAEQELALAVADATLTTAPARSEALARAKATVASAEAQLLRAEANADDAVLTAPFAGTITAVSVVPGESVTTAPVVTLLSADRFELIARVPEIDVGKLALGQRASVTFDTAADTPQTATIDFISPEATVIDGVAYYEARLTLTTLSPWLRSGLNADIDIIVAEVTGLRLPRRFLSEEDSAHTVSLQNQNGSISTTTITTTLVGNDGYVAIEGLSVGTVVVAR
jgi:HlyD family secretion protein